MKTREGTKASIRRKSTAILAERARHRRAAVSAACVALTFAAAGTLWLRRGAANGSGDSLTISAVPLEGDYAGSAAESGQDTGFGGDSDERETERIDRRNDIYTAYNSTYTAPDSMRIYTLPSTAEISLSAKNADEKETLMQISDWLSALDVTKTQSTADDFDVIYVVERRYGENLTTAYIKGNTIKFDGGEWLEFSAENKAEFERMMREIFE